MSFLQSLLHAIMGIRTAAGDGTAEQPGRQSIPAKTTEPVVGFLICIDGKDFGRAFPLKTGRNFIGRDASMDVCLSGEMSVSKDRHAIVVYEPKKNLFLVMSGESKGLVYKNGDVVLVPETLEKNDVLQVGSVSLENA